MNADEAVVKIAANTACTAADATVKAGAVTAVLGKTAARGLIKNGVRGLLGKNAISGTVAASVDFAKDLVLAAQGKLEAREVAGRAAKTGLQVAAGGAAFEIGRSLAVALGASGAPGAFLPIGAGLACSIVIASALNLAIEVGIERPFRELMINTENLYDSLICLDQAARDMGLGQQMFGQFLEENLRLDQNLKTVMKQNRQLSDKMWDAVSAI